MKYCKSFFKSFFETFSIGLVIGVPAVVAFIIGLALGSASHPYELCKKKYDTPEEISECVWIKENP